MKLIRTRTKPAPKFPQSQCFRHLHIGALESYKARDDAERDPVCPVRTHFHPWAQLPEDT